MTLPANAGGARLTSSVNRNWWNLKKVPLKSHRYRTLRFWPTPKAQSPASRGELLIPPMLGSARQIS